MVDRNQNRTAATISNSGNEVNRIINNAIDQLEDVIKGDQQEHMQRSPSITARSSCFSSTQPEGEARSLSRGSNSLCESECALNSANRSRIARQAKSAEQTRSPYVSTAEQPTSAVPTARSMSFYSDVSSHSLNCPCLATARDSSTFDDTSAGSTHVSTAVSPSNDIMISPADSTNPKLNQRRGRSPTLRSSTNSQQAITPRMAWANVSVGGHSVIKPRSNRGLARTTGTPSTGLPSFSAESNGSSTPYSSSNSEHVMSTARLPEDPDLIALRRGQLFGRSSSSHSRANVPCGVEQPITSIPVIPMAPPSEETTTAGPGLDSVPRNTSAQQVDKCPSEHLVKTAEAIGSPCGRKYLHIPQGPSAITTDKIIFYNTDKDSKPSASLGEHHPVGSAEHNISCAQTSVVTGTSIPSDSSHRSPSHTRTDTLPTASNQTHVNTSSFDPVPKTASLNGKHSNSIEANTSRAETPTFEWLANERSSKAVNSSGTLNGSKTRNTNHFEAGSPISASGRLPLTGFDFEQWNIARNDNSDTAMPRLNTARESSEDSLHTAKGNASPTAGVLTAKEATMSQIRDAFAAKEVSNRPTKGVETAKTPGGGQSNISSASIYTPRSTSIRTALPPMGSRGRGARRNSSPYSSGVRRGLFGRPADHQSGTAVEKSAFSASGSTLSERVAAMKKRLAQQQTSSTSPSTPLPYSSRGSSRIMCPTTPGERLSAENSPRSSIGHHVNNQRQSPFLSDTSFRSSTRYDRKRRDVPLECSGSQSILGRKPLIDTPRVSSGRHSVVTPEQGPTTEGSLTERYKKSSLDHRPILHVPVPENSLLHSKNLTNRAPLPRNQDIRTVDINGNSMKKANNSCSCNSSWLSSRSREDHRPSYNEQSLRQHPMSALPLSFTSTSSSGGSRSGRLGRSAKTRSGRRASFRRSSGSEKKFNKRNMRKSPYDSKYLATKTAEPLTPSRQPTQAGSPDTRSDERDFSRAKDCISPQLHTAIDDCDLKLESITAEEMANLQRRGNIVIHEQNSDGTVKLEVHLSCNLNTTGHMKISGYAPSGLCPKKVTVNGKAIWTES